MPSFALGQAKEPKSGVISGIVLDKDTGETLIEAGVEVVETGKRVLTDLDGKFRLELPEGKYEIRFFYPFYQGQRIKNVVVMPSKVTRLDVSLEPTEEEIEVVEVVAEPERATEATQLLMRKKAPAVTDRISAEAIAKQPDPDVAAVVERVPGISVVKDKYVYVRGLGGRYASATLDQAHLPTPELEKKVVPLDLFPSDLVESINVIKSYTPDLPGEFSGGLIQISTITYPEILKVKFSTSAGYNSETTGSHFKTYPGGDWDWLAFDDGRRELPGIIPDDRVRRRGIAGIGYTPEELQRFGRAFENIWNPVTRTAPPPYGANFLIGNKIKKLGFVFNLTYDNKYQYKREDRIYYKVGPGGKLQMVHDYDFWDWEKEFTWSSILNLGYELSPNHKFSIRNLYTKKANDELRFYQGYNDNLKKDVWDRRLYWKEENVYTTQVSGEHRIEKLKSLINWRFAYSKAGLNEPDMREVLYEYEPSLGEYTLAYVTQSGSRWFTELDEDSWDTELDWDLNLKEWLGHPLKVKFGPAIYYRDRTFDHRRFRFVPKNITTIDLTQDPESLFSPENIRSRDGFELMEQTRPIDHYDANHLIVGNYLMIDTSFFKDWRLIGGLRCEYSDQEVESFDPFNPEAGKIITKLTNTDFLPSLNLVYNLKKGMNLRLSFSQTVNRPEFRELAPFEFTDVHGAYETKGNPDLKRVLIKSYDVRWEWFLSPEELLAFSFFYKDFNDPIERIMEPAVQLRSTFQNAAGARNFGFEIEARKSLGHIHSWLSPFNLFANYSYVNSKIQLSPEGTAIMTSKERPLQGQSDHIANFVLEYNPKKWDTTLRLLYNIVGKRISDVGAYGLPDVYEEPTHWLDLVIIKRLGRWGIKFAAENLLNQEIEFTQGEKLYHRYKKGITLSFGIFCGT